MPQDGQESNNNRRKRRLEHDDDDHGDDDDGNSSADGGASSTERSRRVKTEHAVVAPQQPDPATAKPALVSVDAAPRIHQEENNKISDDDDDDGQHKEKKIRGSERGRKRLRQPCSACGHYSPSPSPSHSPSSSPPIVVVPQTTTTTTISSSVSLNDNDDDDPFLLLTNDDNADTDSFIEEGYETASTHLSSTTTTLSSSHGVGHVFEHGRRYHVHPSRDDGGAAYPIPNDRREQEREDMKHAMMLQLLDGRLFLAPLDEEDDNRRGRRRLERVVDAGTGTGAWAIDVGERYPACVVRGVDLTPIQPAWTPPNVSFLVDDCELSWLDRGTVDLAHFRFMAMVLKDMPSTLAHAFDALRPGGYVELHELSGVPLCDDDSMRPDDALASLYDVAGKAWAKLGLDVLLPTKLGPMLAAAGFVNVELAVRKVPIGPWAKDRNLKEIGACQKVAVDELMQSFSGRPFEALGIPYEEGLLRLALARSALNDPGVHRYFEYYFWWAQKPLQGGT